MPEHDRFVALSRGSLAFLLLAAVVVGSDPTEKGTWALLAVAAWTAWIDASRPFADGTYSRRKGAMSWRLSRRFDPTTPGSP